MAWQLGPVQGQGHCEMTLGWSLHLGHVDLALSHLHVALGQWAAALGLLQILERHALDLDAVVDQDSCVAFKTTSCPLCHTVSRTVHPFTPSEIPACMTRSHFKRSGQEVE